MNRKLLLGVLAGVIAVAALSTVLFPPARDGSPAQENALIGQWIIWLAGVTAFAAILGVFIRVHLQRRWIARTQFVDSSATPLRMVPAEAELGKRLRRLGFVVLGEVEIHQPHTRSHHLWAYVRPDRKVRATVSRNWKRISFVTHWPDGFSLETACLRLPTVSLPHYCQQGFPGVSEAHEKHLETMASLAKAHGQPSPIRTIDDLIAAERSDLAVVLPEMAANDRLSRLVILGLIALFAVPLIVLRPF